MSNYVEIYLSTLNSEQTKRSYATGIRDALTFINKPETEIDYLDMIAWANHLKDKSTATQASRIKAVRNYFEFLVDSDVIIKNPVRKVKVPRVENKEFEPVYKDEALKMLDVATNPRDKAIMAVYLSTGMRVAELINLKLNDLEGDHMNIVTKGNKYRKIWLNDECRQIINEYLPYRKSGCDNLFVSNHGTPMRCEVLNKMLNHLAEKAGLDKHLTNHKLRHAFVTDLCENYGIEIASTVVGHSSISVTQRYMHIKEDKIKEVMSNITMLKN